MFSKSRYSLRQGKREKKQDVAIKADSGLSDLPTELKQRIAFFLNFRDLVNLFGTSKSMGCDLDVAMAPSPLTDRASQDKVYEIGRRPACFAAVVPNQEASLPHAMMTFCCDVSSSDSGIL